MRKRIFDFVKISGLRFEEFALIDKMVLIINRLAG
jgi:hypothetical protein